MSYMSMMSYGKKSFLCDTAVTLLYSCHIWHMLASLTAPETWTVIGICPGVILILRSVSYDVSLWFTLLSKAQSRELQVIRWWLQSLWASVSIQSCRFDYIFFYTTFPLETGARKYIHVIHVSVESLSDYMCTKDISSDTETGLNYT